MANKNRIGFVVAVFAFISSCKAKDESIAFSSEVFFIKKIHTPVGWSEDVELVVGRVADSLECSVASYSLQYTNDDLIKVEAKKGVIELYYKNESLDFVQKSSGSDCKMPVKITLLSTEAWMEMNLPQLK